MSEEGEMGRLPYPEDDGRTHFDECYRHHRHHNCAVLELERVARMHNQAVIELDMARRDRDRAEAKALELERALRWYGDGDALERLLERFRRAQEQPR